MDENKEIIMDKNLFNSVKGRMHKSENGYFFAKNHAMDEYKEIIMEWYSWKK